MESLVAEWALYYLDRHVKPRAIHKELDIKDTNSSLRLVRSRLSASYYFFNSLYFLCFRVALSVVVFVQGAANMIVMLLLWLLYHSIVNVGQQWYSFGWESQLLESGFLAIFFVPLIQMKKFSSPGEITRNPSWAVIWGNR